MSLSICRGCAQHCPWERLACDYQLCSLLLGLEVVFVRPCWVPSLALLATLGMVHFAPVIFPITRHTDFWKEIIKHLWQLSYPLSWMQTQRLTLREKINHRNFWKRWQLLGESELFWLDPISHFWRVLPSEHCGMPHSSALTLGSVV